MKGLDWGYSSSFKDPPAPPPRVYLNSTYFKQLYLLCLKIKVLDVDMETVEEWDYELLDSLASFPELMNLQTE